jgi:hypothetical protein
MAIENLYTQAEKVRASEVPHAFAQEPDKWHELQAKISQLTSAPEYLKYLRAQRLLWRYSLHNTLLIWCQKPDFELVQSMTTWNALGRRVKKGEHALRILVPIGSTVDAKLKIPDGGGEATGEPFDPNATGAQPPESTGGDVKKRLVYQVRGFMLKGKVFDISQTEGDPLPVNYTASPLEGVPPDGILAGLEAAAERRGFSVETVTFPDDRNGDCSHELKRIRLAEKLSPAHRAKTLAHELGHGILHGSEFSGTRAQAEVEAESVAYLVCGEKGLETGAYSFAYLTGWGGNTVDGPTATLAASAKRIQEVARTVVSELTPADSPTLEIEKKAAAYRERRSAEFEARTRSHPRRRTAYSR